MNKAAFLSSNGKYRFWLTRVWDESKSLCGWIMLNPSTADHKEDDATIRRCINFSKGFGYGGMIVVNLFAFRAKDKSELKRNKFITGPNNDFFIKENERMQSNHCGLG